MVKQEDEEAAGGVDPAAALAPPGAAPPLALDAGEEDAVESHEAMARVKKEPSAGWEEGGDAKKAPEGKLQLLPRAPPQIFVHADQPKRKQLTLSQSIDRASRAASAEAVSPGSAHTRDLRRSSVVVDVTDREEEGADGQRKKPRTDAAEGATYAISAEDQAAIRKYRTKLRTTARRPLTEKAMQYLVHEFRAVLPGAARTVKPGKDELNKILHRGKTNKDKPLSDDVDEDQVKNFYIQFLRRRYASSRRSTK